MWCGSIMFALLPVFAYYLHTAKMRPGAARSEWTGGGKLEVDELGILMWCSHGEAEQPGPGSTEPDYPDYGLAVCCLVPGQGNL